jgi:4-oxalocrotonate tautomerase
LPWVTIQWYKGRDEKDKDRVAELVTKAICEGVGCPPEAVSIVFHDVDKREWYQAGIPATKR